MTQSEFMILLGRAGVARSGDLLAIGPRELTARIDAIYDHARTELHLPGSPPPEPMLSAWLDQAAGLISARPYQALIEFPIDRLPWLPALDRSLPGEPEWTLKPPPRTDDDERSEDAEKRE